MAGLMIGLQVPYYPLPPPPYQLDMEYFGEL